MVRLISQFTGMLDGEKYSVFKVELEAVSEFGAKKRARGWARKENMTSMSLIRIMDSMKVGEVEGGGKYLPGPMEMSKYQVEVGVRDS